MKGKILSGFPVVRSGRSGVGDVPDVVRQTARIPASNATPLFSRGPHLPCRQRVCVPGDGRKVRHASSHQLRVHLRAKHASVSDRIHSQSRLGPGKRPYETRRQIGLRCWQAEISVARTGTGKGRCWFRNVLYRAYRQLHKYS